jgi:hypothetical protein
MLNRIKRLWPIALVIIGTSADSYFCVQDAEFLRDVELNPLCVAIIDLAGVEGLVATKAAGLGVALTAMFEIERRNIKGWRVVWLAVGLIQAGVCLAYFR